MSALSLKCVIFLFFFKVSQSKVAASLADYALLKGAFVPKYEDSIHKWHKFKAKKIKKFKFTGYINRINTRHLGTISYKVTRQQHK